MPIRSDADLDFMLQDAGVAVVSAASSTFGILRKADALEQTDGQQLQKRVTTLLVRTGSIADLVTDLPLNVGGASYVVHWFDIQDDGQLTKVLIAAVSP